jgi:pyruvate ferredoxin oxidoreductase gamma subunit
MFWIRVRGRDTGEVLATAELLKAAAVAEGKRAVASPVPMAWPAEAMCAIGTATSAAGGRVLMADGLIIQDPSVLGRPDIFARLSQEAYVLVNAACGFGDLGISDRVERFCRDRTIILPAARLDTGRHDGLIRSAAMLGGFAALSRVISLDGAVSALENVAPESARRACAEAAGAAYEFVRAERDALAA